MTQKGTILAYGEARHGEAANDWADIDIVLRRSEDGGKSWRPFQVVEDGKLFQSDHRNTAAKRAPGQENFVTCNNAVMFVDHSGGLLHLLY
jgi:sialidase-1